jgi:hypothetical protein
MNYLISIGASGTRDLARVFHASTRRCQFYKNEPTIPRDGRPLQIIVVYNAGDALVTG